MKLLVDILLAVLAVTVIFILAAIYAYLSSFIWWFSPVTIFVLFVVFVTWIIHDWRS